MSLCGGPLLLCLSTHGAQTHSGLCCSASGSPAQQRAILTNKYVLFHCISFLTRTEAGNGYAFPMVLFYSTSMLFINICLSAIFCEFFSNGLFHSSITLSIAPFLSRSLSLSLSHTHRIQTNFCELALSHFENGLPHCPYYE